MLTSTLPVRIYYEDTDAGGVVYYANYLKFFERGRTEFLRDFNIQQDTLLDEGIAFMVKKVDMDCIKSARFNQLLSIETEVASYRKASLLFTQKVFDENRELLCQADTLIACVNLNKMKPTAIPTEIIEVITRAR
ncbi:tol-pal system-associated acyl-CoA thioesterase [Psychromonas sp. 14N.309.X.WAT.B.A12]|uniref:tol-pal system-associated acyl-CoA thioesterase n=1 Tax=unclassified Psychromonas TaxID=2614957 RepID=UPI0025B280D8|nr:tol-pal system-associated acyl-CoA thioesterase [Psychromonas sp. 14N.309.X.WAT.B.A12]MDN2663947.1 tol-pal system-associated acyl-CoA thioesterase [Psychromonas sp. 14N.309.X.WAT.B.A12]